MRYDTSVDTDTLDRYARELLTRPSNYAAHTDYGQYDTHAPVYAMATNSGDLIAESNWHAMRDELNGVIVHGGREQFDDLHDLGESHWAFGPLDVLYVRVRDECTGAYTPAFIRAVELLESLHDYPLLDESDYSEREYAAWESVVNDALDSAARTHRDTDEPVDEQMFYTLVTCRDEYRDALCEGFSPDEVDWDRVQSVYDTARNDHYGWLAAQYLAAIQAPPPGQLAMF